MARDKNLEEKLIDDVNSEKLTWQQACEICIYNNYSLEDWEEFIKELKQ